MPYSKFKPDEVLYNQVEANPQAKFVIHSGTTFYNDKAAITGTYVVNAGHIPTGHISLHEVNVDRQAGQLVYPFITKDGSVTSFKTVTTKAFNSDFAYGDTITSSYPMSSSISREFFDVGNTRYRFESLKTALQSYTPMSSEFTSSNIHRSLDTGSLNIISIPSIFYGSSIKKGSVDLKFYITGNLIGRAQDIHYNGNLIQTEPIGSPMSGSTVGLAMYNEGVLLLTSSTDLSSEEHQARYVPGSLKSPSWIYFGSKGAAADRVTGSIFEINFQGTTYTPVITMFAKAPAGELNWSNNPTYKLYGNATGSVSGAYQYKEEASLIKNINSSSFNNYKERFDNITYISSVGIYDEDMNLIGVAKMANPVKKVENQDFLFKLKLDI